MQRRWRYGSSWHRRMRQPQAALFSRKWHLLGAATSSSCRAQGSTAASSASTINTFHVSLATRAFVQTSLGNDSTPVQQAQQGVAGSGSSAGTAATAAGFSDPAAMLAAASAAATAFVPGSFAAMPLLLGMGYGQAALVQVRNTWCTQHMLQPVVTAAHQCLPPPTVSSSDSSSSRDLCAFRSCPRRG